MATRAATGGRAGGLLGEGSSATLTRATGGKGCPPTQNYYGQGEGLSNLKHSAQAQAHEGFQTNA